MSAQLRLYRRAVLVVTALLLNLTPLRAIPFGFTYEFADGAKVIGSIEADWGGPYLQDVRGAQWSFYLPDGTFAGGDNTDPGLLDPFGPQLIPSSGSFAGLRLVLERDTNGQWDYNFTISGGSAYVALPINWSEQHYQSERIDGGWHLNRPAGVPEGGSSVLLVGLSLLVIGGIGFWRGRPFPAAVRS